MNGRKWLSHCNERSKHDRKRRSEQVYKSRRGGQVGSPRARHAGKRSDGCPRPPAARVAPKAFASRTALNLADALGRLAFSCYPQSACLERVATRPVRPSAVPLNKIEGVGRT